jgi:hypothetical protein
MSLGVIKHQATHRLTFLLSKASHSACSTYLSAILSVDFLFSIHVLIEHYI